MKNITFLLVFTFCSGCTPIPVGGEGSTSKGEKLVAEAKLGIDGNNKVKILSSKGWECDGSYKRSTTSTTRKFPLACTNGAKGNAIMSVNQIQQKATIAFSLNNGVSGNVRFGLVN